MNEIFLNDFLLMLSLAGSLKIISFIVTANYWLILIDKYFFLFAGWEIELYFFSEILDLRTFVILKLYRCITDQKAANPLVLRHGCKVAAWLMLVSYFCSVHPVKYLQPSLCKMFTASTLLNICSLNLSLFLQKVCSV